MSILPESNSERNGLHSNGKPKSSPAEFFKRRSQEEQEAEEYRRAMEEECREVVEDVFGGGFPYETPKGLADPDVAEETARTDAANAKRLIYHYHASLRYVPELREWVVWDGLRWRRDVADVGVQAKAQATGLLIWEGMADALRAKSPHDPHRKRLLNFGTYSSSAKGVANMITLARSHSGMQIDCLQLDRGPMLLNLPNGTLDLETGKMRRHKQKDWITKLCPTPYDRIAKAPTWERFLHEVFAGDEAVIGYLQRLLGYGLTGDVSEQMLPIFWGEGSNGKSTLVNAVTDVVGLDYAGSPPRELFKLSKYGDSHPTDLMTLMGKRLMMAQETEAGCRLNEALIKHLTGGDLITARYCHKDNATFRPTHKLILSTNYKPQVRGTDYAVWRRLRLIPFNVSFKGRRADRGLSKKLAAEAPGILAWMVRGCRDWRREGMQTPPAVELATEGYKAEQDEVGLFIKECCQLDPAALTPAAELYEAFRKATPYSEMTQTAFGKELSRLGYLPEQMTKKPHANKMGRRGLRLSCPGPA